jgi:hypothetical protein
MRQSYVAACERLRSIARDYRDGRISLGEWTLRVHDVLATLDPSVVPPAMKVATDAASASPGVADPADECAAENVAVLAHRDSVNSDYVQGHAA